AVDDGEPRQVGFQMWTPALHVPVAEAYILGVRLLLRVPALGVLKPLVRETLEERVDELVVLPNAGSGEPAAQEQRVDPVDLLDVQEMLDERALRAEPVANLLPGVVADFLAREVDHD